jgi:hypothetical protein
MMKTKDQLEREFDRLSKKHTPDIIRQNGKTYVSTGYVSRKLIGYRKWCIGNKKEWNNSYMLGVTDAIDGSRQALALRSLSRRKI